MIRQCIQDTPRIFPQLVETYKPICTVHGRPSSYVHTSKEISERGMGQDKVLNNRGGHRTNYVGLGHRLEGPIE
jgi:hypothetical protein